MSCVHLLEVPGAWREFICGISGVHMIARDCLRIAPDCIPWQGLQVALSKVKVEQFPPALQAHVELAARQASDPTRLPASREREEAAVALGVSPVAVVQSRTQGQKKARESAKKSRAAKARWAKYPLEERRERMAAIRTVGPREKNGA